MIPLINRITLWCRVGTPKTCRLATWERPARTSRGSVIPRPNERKVPSPSKRPVAVAARAR